ncbi:hypothetical protein CQ052_21375 [Ochrobactrum sp. MYb15]|nr:hypothetical protein CQZ90_16655 [Ochrobactrum sp. MYb19]PRA63244.1 hypothetical protein CQ053_15185 [Ochrobactrum sp. MYb18]PRA73402.1 hypothetical protein CQ049_20200 [Brucella thiophenivorans]PRA88239.1 hypothetical protein CQ051_17100 [Ochrobactrum sp. MYb14]PRA94925.1 hypothetical protein CQ052_21375 [Ochrobactrum sp. MYb15]
MVVSIGEDDGEQHPLPGYFVYLFWLFISSNPVKPKTQAHYLRRIDSPKTTNTIHKINVIFVQSRA